METSRPRGTRSSTTTNPSTKAAVAGEPSRNRILASATRLFARKGYDAASVREIASACQLTLPTIYHFFDSKLGLYRECRLAVLGGAAARMRKAMTTPDQPHRVEAMTKELCELLLNDELILAFLQSEIHYRSHPAEKALSPWPVLGEMSAVIMAANPQCSSIGVLDAGEGLVAFVLGQALMHRAFRLARGRVDPAPVAQAALAMLKAI